MRRTSGLVVYYVVGVVAACGTVSLLAALFSPPSWGITAMLLLALAAACANVPGDRRLPRPHLLRAVPDAATTSATAAITFVCFPIGFAPSAILALAAAILAWSVLAHVLVSPTARAET